VVAVDLKAGREVILSQGRLVDAILATVAVPGVFPPKQYGDAQLVDGAVLDPVPVSVARTLAPALPVVAVILDITTNATRGFNSIPLSLPVPVPPLLVERLTRTRVAQSFNIFLQSVDVGSRALAEMRLRIDNPEVVIRPDVNGIGLLDKVDVHKIVHKGEEATELALPELQRAVSWPNRLRRRLFI
jgi:NTE family protein